MLLPVAKVKLSNSQPALSFQQAYCNNSTLSLNRCCCCCVTVVDDSWSKMTWGPLSLSAKG